MKRHFKDQGAGLLNRRLPGRALGAWPTDEAVGALLPNRVRSQFGGEVSAGTVGRYLVDGHHLYSKLYSNGGPELMRPRRSAVSRSLTHLSFVFSSPAQASLP